MSKVSHLTMFLPFTKLGPFLSRKINSSHQYKVINFDYLFISHLVTYISYVGS
jgi:hypothetical protein